MEAKQAERPVTVAQNWVKRREDPHTSGRFATVGGGQTGTCIVAPKGAIRVLHLHSLDFTALQCSSDPDLGFLGTHDPPECGDLAAGRKAEAVKSCVASQVIVSSSVLLSHWG